MVKITHCVYVPGPEATITDPGCMPEFMIVGTTDLGGNGEVPFACKISCEIDGRDMEYELVTGPNMSFEDDQDAWDEFLEAWGDLPAFTEEFERLSELHLSALGISGD